MHDLANSFSKNKNILQIDITDMSLYFASFLYIKCKCM